MNKEQFRAATALLNDIEKAVGWFEATDKYLYVENEITALDIEAREWMVNDLEDRFKQLIDLYHDVEPVEAGAEKSWILDNEHWRICDCIDLLREYPAGTTFRMKHNWAFTKVEGTEVPGMTDPVDVEVTSTKPHRLPRIVHELMLAYQEKCGGTRFYYIEGVIPQDDGSFEVVWGT